MAGPVLMDDSAYRAAEARLWEVHGARPAERRVHGARTGTDLRVQEVGEGPPIVFLHGANTSGSSWIALAARLPDFRCLIVDRPGTGLSAPLAGRIDRSRIERLGDDLLVDLIDAFDLTSAHVVATSFGGFLALRGAAAHPERVGRMVQFSWPVGAPTTWVPLALRLSAAPLLGALIARLPASERSVRMTFRQIGHRESLADGRITQADLDTYLALLRHTPTLREDQRMARTLASALRGLGDVVLSAALLARVSAPTHFIWGGRDPFGGPDTARTVAGLIPGATVEILPDAGHAPWLDALEHCVAAVRVHLGRGGIARGDDQRTESSGSESSGPVA